MKILTVIESLGNGGAERLLVNTLPILQSLGNECHVVTLFNDNLLQHELETKGLKVINLTLQHRWDIIGAIQQLKKVIDIERYDIVHAHLFFAHFYIGLVKKVYRKDFKSVVTFHNLGYQADPANTLYKKVRKWADGQILNSCFNAKIAVSNAVKEHFQKYLAVQDIQVIYNGFPGDQIREFASLQNRVPDIYNENDFNIITPGRLVKEKGHNFLIDSAKELNKKFDNLQFFIAGDGPSYNQIEKSIRDRQLDNIHLLGRLDQNDLFNYMFHADLVVIPSLSEGFPMVVGEAMMMGKPIVTTNVGGIPDLIDQEINGIMVNPGDTKALVDSIEKMILNPDLRKELALNAIKKSSVFEIEEVVAQMMKLYKRINS